MAKQTNRVEWEFLLNQRQLDQGLKKSQRGFKDTNRDVGTLQRGMGSLKTAALGLGLALGAREILQFGKDAITAATDFDESVNAVKVASGEAAEAILKIGENSAEAFGISKTELNEAAVVFSGFAEDIAAEGGDPATIFEEYITRAADFASVFNIDVKEALDKFKSGLAGESEPLRNFGLDLSAAAVQAHAVETGVIDIGKTMTNSEKVRVRYSLLMEETAKFQGDFARTAEDAANKGKVLDAKLEDLTVTIGRELLPVYETFLQTTVDLVPALEGAVGVLPTLTGNVGALGTAVGTATDPTKSFGEKVGGVAGALFDMSENVNPVILGFRGARGIIRTFTEGDEKASDLAESMGDSHLALADMRREVGNAPLAALDDYAVTLGEVAEQADDAATALDATAAASRRIIAARLEAIELDKIYGAGIGLKPTPLAAGGTAIGGQAHLVGERGPELFVPGRTGTVIPNGGGGGGNTYNITITAIDPAGAAEAVADAIRLYESTNGSI